MIDASAVNAVRDLAQQAQSATLRTVTIADRTYSTTPLHEVKQLLPAPAALTVHTLTGLVDYIAHNRDALDLATLLVHVGNPREVYLRSRLSGEQQQRFAYLEAEALNRFAAVPSFGFGRWLETEDMMIALLALFEDTEDRAKLFRLLGNLTDEEVKTKVDDGVTQRATVKTGVAVLENVSVPNPVRLRPFRTFAEIAQPESPFVFRLRKGPSGVTAALFEADGGAWTLDAITGIREYLRGVLPFAVEILA